MMGNDHFGSGNADRRGSRGRGKCPVTFFVSSVIIFVLYSFMIPMFKPFFFY